MAANKALREKAKQVRGRLRKPDYALPDGQYACKLCGTPIMIWKTVGHRPDGSEMVALGPNSSYQEIELEFEDEEGKHVSSVCKSCAKSIGTNELEALYVVDLERLADLEEQPRVDWSLRRNRRPH